MKQKTKHKRIIYHYENVRRAKWTITYNTVTIKKVKRISDQKITASSNLLGEARLPVFVAYERPRQANYLVYEALPTPQTFIDFKQAHPSLLISEH